MKKLIALSLLILSTSAYAMEDDTNLANDPANYDMSDSDEDTQMNSEEELKSETEALKARKQALIAKIIELKKDPEMFALFTANVKKSFANDLLVLECGAEKADLQQIDILLKSGADINFQNNNGRTALMEAAYDKKIDAVKLLIANKADLNIQNKTVGSGSTALKLALSYPCINVRPEKEAMEIAKLLLDSGADINSRDNYRKTILMHEVWSSNAIDNTNVLKFLLQNGTKYSLNMDLKDDAGRTALDHAYSEGNLEVIKLIETYLTVQKTMNGILEKTKRSITKNETLKATNLNKDVAGIVADYSI